MRYKKRKRFQRGNNGFISWCADCIKTNAWNRRRGKSKNRKSYTIGKTRNHVGKRKSTTYTRVKSGKTDRFGNPFGTVYSDGRRY